jgi:hypothetical protein
VSGIYASLNKPFLNWAGKAERHQISVPTVPLFVHERQSTKAILEGIRNRRATFLQMHAKGVIVWDSFITLSRNQREGL